MGHHGPAKVDYTGCVTKEDYQKRNEEFWAPPALSLLKKKDPPTIYDLLSRDAGVVETHVQQQLEHNGLNKEQHRRHSDSVLSPPTPESISLPTTHHKPTTNKALQTPSATQATPSDADIVKRINDILLTPEEETIGSPLQPSKYMVERRNRILEERKRKEREAAEEKEAQEKAAAEERKKQEREAAIIAARELRLTRRFPSKPLITPLSANWERDVANILRARNGQQITTAPAGTALNLGDFQKVLVRTAWLNDEIVNAYIDTVVDAANQAANDEMAVRGEKPSSVPKFMAHNTYFYKDLVLKGPACSVRLMKRKGAAGKDILELDTLFIPMMEGNNHWTLGVVRPIARTIEYFNSMGGHSTAFVDNMKNWLKHHMRDAYVEDEWKVLKTPCARQNNGYDCGVFVCTNVLCIAVGFDTTCYTEPEMAIQRKRIAAVLLNKGFKGDFAWANFIDD